MGGGGEEKKKRLPNLRLGEALGVSHWKQWKCSQ